MIFKDMKKKTSLGFLLFLLAFSAGAVSFSQEDQNTNYRTEKEKRPTSQVQVGPNGRTYTGPAARYDCYADCRSSGLEIAFCMRACGLGMMEEP